jgi:enhancing lycopene biosynthesis protein 2
MYQTGILIGGCGLYDGTETHEAVLAMLAIDRRGWRLRCLTTDRDQLHVVDHTTGNEQEGARRNVMEEAARLSRVRVMPLQRFDPEELDALVIPGGYGCAKNLMTGFAEAGRPRRLQPEVTGLLEHCLGQRKPIGLISLADLLIYPLVPDLEARFAAWQQGEAPVVDPERRVAYTPGYRASERIGEVAAGIDGLVGALGRLLESEE